MNIHEHTHTSPEAAATLRDALRDAHAHDPTAPGFDAMWQRAQAAATAGEAANEDAEAPTTHRWLGGILAVAVALVVAIGGWHARTPTPAQAPAPAQIATPAPDLAPTRTTATPDHQPDATTPSPALADLTGALQEWESPTDFLLTEEALEDDFLVFADQPPLPGEAPGATSVPSIMELSELEEL